MKCPNCGHEQADGLPECESCQVIFAKLAAKKKREAEAAAAGGAEGEVPTSELMEEIDRDIRSLQLKAGAKVFPEATEGGGGPEPSAMQDLCATAGGTIRFVYTVERFQGRLLHTLSSQLVADKSKQYHIQCMLVAMMVLQKEVDDAGIKPDDVKFDIAESDRGTQYLRVLLTPDQHRLVMEKAKDAPLPARGA